MTCSPPPPCPARAAAGPATLLRLAAAALFVFCAADAPAHATNLLVNAGAESGAVSPWTTSSFFPATRGVTTGSMTVGSATLQPTEGTHWLSGDSTASSVGAAFSGFFAATQRVDVRGQGINSVRFGGDGFAAGQILSGSGVLDVWHRHILLFYDNSLGFLGVDDVNALGPSQIWKSVADRAASSTGVTNVSTVPAGTAYIDFIQRYDLRAYAASSMTYRVVAGLDNASLEVAAVPEPSSIALALGGLGCCGFSVWRRRFRHYARGVSGCRISAVGDDSVPGKAVFSNARIPFRAASSVG